MCQQLSPLHISTYENHAATFRTLDFRQKVKYRFDLTGVPVKWAFDENQKGMILIGESLILRLLNRRSQV